MSVSLCPKCGLAANCFCIVHGKTTLDKCYEFILICNCGHKKTIKESGGCWSAPSTTCPFCGKKYDLHQAPPKV